MRVYSLQGFRAAELPLDVGAVATYCYADGEHTWVTERTLALLREAAERFPALRVAVASAAPHEMNAAKHEALMRRVHYTVESYLQDPPAPATLCEVLALLATRPEWSVEYLGRAKPGVAASKARFATATAAGSVRAATTTGAAVGRSKADTRASKIADNRQ